MNWLSLNSKFACILAASLVVTPAIFAQQISFTNSPWPVIVGSGPSSLATGDFNHDGKPDLAIVNATDNTVSIELGTGNGSFSLAGTFQVNGGLLSGSLPIGIAVADFNNDGNLDLAITNIPTNIIVDIAGTIGANVAILLGDGKGGFKAGGTFDTKGNLPSSIVVADFNNDGNTDIAVTNLNSGDVTIVLGDGQGRFAFAANSPFHIGTRPATVAVGDFNGDGKPDLAIANADDNQVSILLGYGDGTFYAAANSPINVGLRPDSIAVADFNSDGKLDLAVANLADSTVSILIGDGTGSFSAGATYGVGTYPVAVVKGDFNNDGNPDLAVANRSSNMVSVLLGNGDGTFVGAKSVAVGGGPQSIAVADYNGDSQLDLAVVNTATNSVTVLLNKGDTTAPATVASFAPLPNLNNWNNTAVALTLSATDNAGGSGVKEIHYTLNNGTPTIVSGASSVLNFSGEGVSSGGYYAVDNAGNIESSHAFQVSIDLTAPTINSSASPASNAAHWNNSNVRVTFGCNDALSGVASCSPPALVATEGTSSVTGTAADMAGNSASITATVKLDKTPPTILSNLSPPANAAQWNNSNVTVTFSCSDALSGIANCSPAAVVTTEGTSNVTATASDLAGNNTSTIATVKLDKTPPTIVSSQAPAANAANWNNTNVTVTFTCADALSGIASCSPPALVATEGTSSVTGISSDVAGNNSSTVATVRLDKTPPATAFAMNPGPLRGRQLATGTATTTITPGNIILSTTCFNSFGGVASFSATDNVSGVAAIKYGTAKIVTGQPVPNPAPSNAINGAAGAIPFTSSGAFVLNYGSVDNAANQETTNSRWLVVNSVAGLACSTSPVPVNSLPTSGTVTVTGTLHYGTSTVPVSFSFKY